MKNLFTTLILTLTVFAVNAQSLNLPQLAAIKLQETEQFLNNSNHNNNRRSRGSRSPEQDCINAIPVCQQTYSQANSFSGGGSINELNPNNTCLLTGETNSVWYIFTAQTAGTVTFSIQTVFDYDFALYNITNTGCNLGGVTPLRCNYSADNGITGLQLPAQNGNLSYSAGGTAMMPAVNVQAGETYVLLVNNYTGDNTGYQLVFGGSASIFDNSAPTLASVVDDCTTGTLVIRLSEPVQCSSMANNNTLITGPTTVTVNSVSGSACVNGSFTNELVIDYTLASPVDGQYSIIIDGLIDNCGNIMLPSQLTFNILNAPQPTASTNFICQNNVTPVTLSIPGPLPSGYSATWSNNATGLNTTVNPGVTTTYSVTLTNGTCTKTNQITITVGPVPAVTVFPANPFICGGASVTLTATSPLNATFTWSNGTTGNILVVNPATTTDYWVEADFNGCVSRDTVTVVSGGPSPAPTCANIYVSTSGTSNGAGTPADPVDLITGITMSQCNNSVIKMAQGTYTIDNAISNLSSFTTLEGGFDDLTNWSKVSIAGTTTIIRSAQNPDGPSTAPRLVAFYLNGQSFFRFQDLTIQVADAPPVTPGQGGVTTYGIHLTNCSDYNITRCQISVGKGGNGGTGTVGAAGSNGARGGNAGGQSGGAGVGGGGNGGRGGDEGGIFQRGRDGRDGSNSSTGASGGDGGDGACGIAFCNLIQTAADGDDGANGAPGGNGSSGLTGPVGTYVGGFFIPGTGGSSGGSGVNGTSGGGGGGGGGVGCLFSVDDGGGGGGGAAGGTGGVGGNGGIGGGGSFAIYVFNNGANGNVVDCNVTASTSGIGGTGGAGGSGGAGGNGGNGYNAGCGGTGGRGGFGGAGGTGGIGGSGSAGDNGIVFSDLNNPGTSLVTNINNFNLAAQTPIRSSNISCTATIVDFNSVASGNWAFGSGSSPATASGVQNTTTQYSSIGRKIITFGTNDYTDFFNVATSGANNIPDISTTAPQLNGQYIVCIGDLVDFSSSITGLNYDWVFSGGTSPLNYNGSTFNQLTGISFTQPGSYTVALSVENDCCGASDYDTLQIVVDSIPVVSITPLTTTLCEGESVTLNAQGTGTFLWVPTGNVTQSITVSPTVGSFTYGVIVTNQLGCKGDTAFADVTVNPSPVIDVVGDNTLCVGDSTVLSVTGFPGANITWTGGVSSQDDSITVSPIVPTTYFAQAELNNCVTNTDSLTVFVDDVPTPVILGDSVFCSGDNVVLEATGGKNYLWSTGDTTTFISFTAGVSETVTVIGESDLGCPSSLASFSFIVNQRLVVSVVLSELAPFICTGDDGLFSATPTNGGDVPTYRWFVNDSLYTVVTDSIVTISGLVDGDSIRVEIFSTEACVVSSVANSNIEVVVVKDLPNNVVFTEPESALGDTLNNYDDPLQLAGSPTGGFFSGYGVEGDFFNPVNLDVDTNYNIYYTYTDSNGCVNSDTTFINIYEVGNLYSIVNAFTPNGDGLNDGFTIILSSAAELVEFNIFNRWGELIHNDPGTPWDGTLSGNEQPIGVYVYVALILTPDSPEPVRITGDFTLIR